MFKCNKVARNFISVMIFFAGICVSDKAVAECRFWAAIAEESVPEDVILNGLLVSENSIYALSRSNRDGWGVVYYGGKGIVLEKGAKPAYQDKRYRENVVRISKLQPNPVAAHVRAATSGCRGIDVQNPHPFTRHIDGKDWSFGHNGSINKSMLVELIGKEYLEKNPPVTCTNMPPSSWVDSELYFIFILKNIAQSGGDVEAGIKNALSILKEGRTGRRGTWNFFLSDGDVLWAFRAGHSLYYYWDPVREYAQVSSMYPSSEKGEWIDVPENTLIIMKKGKTPVLTAF